MQLNSYQNTYNPKTRIGNWSEETELEQYYMMDYMKKRENNDLESSRIQKQLFHGLAREEVNQAENGYLNYDQPVLLQNQFSKGFLACDVNEKSDNSQDEYSVSTSSNGNACVRTVFTFQKYEGLDSIVRYGDKVCVQSNPRVLPGQTLYLKSEPVSLTKVGRFSRQCEVTITTKNSYNNVFEVCHHDFKQRIQSEGQPVNLYEPLALKHCYTQQHLACENYQFQTIFGVEKEVFVKSFNEKSKVHTLRSENEGRNTVDQSQKGLQQQNLWNVVVQV